MRWAVPAALLALAACGDKEDAAGPGSTELSRAEAEQQRTAAQADADVRAAEVAAKPRPPATPAR